MAYTPTTWHGGDVLSAEAMNKIEQGISNVSNIFLIEANNNNNNTLILNKTFKEIKEAFFDGKQCLIKTNNEYRLLCRIDLDFYIVEGDFIASSENDYPIFTQNNPITV